MHMQIASVPFDVTVAPPARCIGNSPASFASEVTVANLRFHLVAGSVLAVIALWAPHLVQRDASQVWFIFVPRRLRPILVLSCHAVVPQPCPG